MAKLRKMLGKIDDPVIVELMKVIETQSQETLAAWSMDYVEANLLPVYEKSCDDRRFREILEGCREYLKGERKLKEIKPLLKDARTIAKETEDPIAQAAARGISTACAVVQTPTNALGYTFYTAAAIVYDRVGLLEKAEVYDTLAVAEFEKILASLKEAAVEDEPNPAKITWGC